MATDVPPSLKKIKIFLTRAEELDRDSRDTKNPESRVVAYNARQYAVLTGIPLAGQDGAAKTCLGQILNQLEKEKDAMSVFSKDEHWKICRKVADRVFDKADAEDRAGMATKVTAKNFYAAGTFYDILTQFYGEWKEGHDVAGYEEATRNKEEEGKRRLYCKWKATDILNAIKEGRTPIPGGVQKDDESVERPSEEESKSYGYPEVPQVAPVGSPIREKKTTPSADFFNEYGRGEFISPTKTYDDAPYEMPPPAYNGFELNLNGDPTPAVEDDDSGTEDEEIFIPGAAEAAAKSRENNIFVEETPPPFPHARENSNNVTPSFPPPAATKPLPPPLPPPMASSRSLSSNTGVMSSLFGKSSSPSSAKLSKEKMADAVELTKFALAALQKGDAELGRERLEQALGLWRR
jgi:vacuolar protein sorting-associated protein VTA1